MELFGYELKCGYYNRKGVLKLWPMSIVVNGDDIMFLRDTIRWSVVNINIYLIGDVN